MAAQDEMPSLIESLDTNHDNNHMRGNPILDDDNHNTNTNTHNNTWKEEEPAMDVHHQPRVRARRRSSCSALPSTTIMELNDLVDSSSSGDEGGRGRSTKGSLGSFLRFNNSFYSSVTSLSDTSACAMSGDGSDVETNHQSDNDDDDDANNKDTNMEEKPAKTAGTDVVDHPPQIQPGVSTTCVTTQLPDSMGAEDMDRIKTKKKKKKKKKLSKESKKEKPSRRRMQRRSSWSGAMASEAPQEYQENHHHDHHHHRDIPSFMQERVPLEVTPQLGPDEEPLLVYDLDEPKSSRRRMNRRSSWHTSVSNQDDDDGVISSFKSSTTSGSTLMYEEQHFEQKDTIITSSSSQPYNDTTTTTTTMDEQVERPIPAKRRSRRTRRSASWGCSAGDEEPASDITTTHNNSNSMDAAIAPSGSTNDVEKTKEASDDDAYNTDEQQQQQLDSSCSVRDVTVKEVKRTLLMVKHVHSGAARARRRASWTASTVNYLDEYVPSSPNASPQQVIADVFSSLKKNAQETEEEDADGFVQSEEHDAPMDVVEESQPLPQSSVEYQDSDMSPNGGATATTAAQEEGKHADHHRRMERRSSWHTSSAGYGESTSTIDTRMSQTSQKSQTFVMDLNKPNKRWKAKEVLEEEVEEEVSQGRRTRSWKLGKANQSDQSRSPDLVVVSSANMPQNDRPSLSSSQGISCIQLTAFGDVTTIGCDR